MSALVSASFVMVAFYILGRLAELEAAVDLVPGRIRR